MYAGTMIFNAEGLAPRAKYSAQTMNAAHSGRLTLPSQMPKGRLTTTVIATASQSGIVFLVSVSTPNLLLVGASPPGWSTTTLGQTSLPAANTRSGRRGQQVPFGTIIDHRLLMD